MISTTIMETCVLYSEDENKYLRDFLENWLGS